MESNKDESLKCLQIAKEYLAKDNYEKARKLAAKSLKLYPSSQAAALLKVIDDAEVSGPSSRNGAKFTDSQAGDDLRHRRSNDPKDSNGTTEPNGIHSNYTPDQAAAVKKIKACTNLYDTLGVAKNCDDDDLKRAYRKLALKFHPDKNRAPGAAEAFKAVGHAYSVLSDSDKRHAYDRYGDEAQSRPNTRNRHYHEEDDEFSAEDLFNMFFGSAAGFQTATYSSNRRSQRTQRQTFHFTNGGNRHRENEGAASVLLQLSPILIMIALSVLSMLLQEETPFKLYQTKKYDSPRQSQRLDVPYFVQKDFTKKYTNAYQIRKLEHEIEAVYIQNLRNECYKEQLMQENMKWKAKINSDNKAFQEANTMELKTCIKLKKLIY